MKPKYNHKIKPEKPEENSSPIASRLQKQMAVLENSFGNINDIELLLKEYFSEPDPQQTDAKEFLQNYIKNNNL